MRLRPTLIAVGLLLPLTAAALTIAYSDHQTEKAISAFEDAVRDRGRTQPPPTPNAETLAALPPPVQRYLDFALPDPKHDWRWAEIRMEGDFRRPRTEDFEPTKARQVIALGDPALAFSATTPILPGIWARVYDAYVDGRMEMKAKLLSTLTIVDERESPELNRISLRRWLLESPLYPMALFPGGLVRWEAIDGRHARAIVSAEGLEASLVATFREDGSLERFDAEGNGDLNTPYHGSGEHVTRTDYELVDGVRIPMGFVIARAAGGKIYPFWKGHITAVSFRP
jgi:hypothetical protein